VIFARASVLCARSPRRTELMTTDRTRRHRLDMGRCRQSRCASGPDLDFSSARGYEREPGGDTNNTVAKLLAVTDVSYGLLTSLSPAPGTGRAFSITLPWRGGAAHPERSEYLRRVGYLSTRAPSVGRPSPHPAAHFIRVYPPLRGG